MRFGGGSELRVQRRIGQLRGQRAAAALDERRAAAGDVHQLADHVGIHARGEIIEAQVDVIEAVAELGGEVVAQVIGGQQVEVAARGDVGAARLGHLLAVDGQEAMHVHAGRAAVARRHAARPARTACGSS